MKIGPIEVTFHRTVRVADGRAASNLPPSLGHAKLTPVKDFADNCPESWEKEGFFVPLHDKEALWLGFHGGPAAMIVGAGGINALSGQKLGTKLETGGYLVTPPQPWLDGWKAEDGTVYQFVATPFKQGDGLSVGEQILGAESKSGGLGIAVFESKEPLKAQPKPFEGYGNSAFGDPSEFTYLSAGTKGFGAQLDSAVAACASSTRGGLRGMSMGEMGVGKGGKITQKVYDDPYGIEVWKEEPSAVVAIYLVSAQDYATITGTAIPQPVGAESYDGKWFGLKDQELSASAGTTTFSGLKTVFAGDTSNVVADEVVEVQGE